MKEYGDGLMIAGTNREKQHTHVYVPSYSSAFVCIQCNLFFLSFFSGEVYLVYSASGVQQRDSILHTYTRTHLFFVRFFSLIGYYKILSIVPCAIQ